MAKLVNLVSRDAARALEEFSEDFDGILAAADPADQWAKSLGLSNSSTAIQTTYPIPIDAAGYKLRSGDDQLRELFERSITMSPVEWYDGVQILARVAEAPDFVGWGNAPQRIAREYNRLPNRLVAAMLHANPLLDLYTQKLPGGNEASTIRLFAENHPVNILGTVAGVFSNTGLTSAKIDAALLEVIKTKFRKRLAPNGKPMGLRVSHLLVPAALEEQAKGFLESDNLVIAVQNAGGTIVGGVPTNNRHKGSIQLVVGDELEDDDLIYFLDLPSGCSSWIVQDTGSPEEIRYDKDSAKYKDSGYIGVKYVTAQAAAAALPHAIECVQIG